VFGVFRGCSFRSWKLTTDSPERSFKTDLPRNTRNTRKGKQAGDAFRVFGVFRGCSFRS
jgi:hypothetical protein